MFWYTGIYIRTSVYEWVWVFVCVFWTLMSVCVCWFKCVLYLFVVRCLHAFSNTGHRYTRLWAADLLSPSVSRIVCSRDHLTETRSKLLHCVRFAWYVYTRRSQCIRFIFHSTREQWRSQWRFWVFKTFWR